ncbi:Toxoplasma gondii family A protein [Besnoitia besnoiti]|uniref:Toxoplasma gondii family A protein n=1 Tax=Besnoitia besnoiti TaxID=94643 RepID=A0A2A9MDZ0_BESBE|nr:Toxoplasma gondii family A protein [Besnoitia besnoiti]PFH36728.1 Toxoplasma gondii family A protein [Besnoitia besnoiti]
MAPVLLQALSSSLLVGAALHCSATGAGETTAEPESIITIPEDGVDVDEQTVVWLGPSKAFRVVDSTNAAIFMPQLTEAPSAEPSSEQMNSVAYVFENGGCDFTKTVEYKKLFPDYQKPLWVRDPAVKPLDGEEESPAPAANYTFTNPPADVVGDGASFCVRFMMKRTPQSPPVQPEGSHVGTEHDDKQDANFNDTSKVPVEAAPTLKAGAESPSRPGGTNSFQESDNHAHEIRQSPSVQDEDQVVNRGPDGGSTPGSKGDLEEDRKEHSPSALPQAGPAPLKELAPESEVKGPPILPSPDHQKINSASESVSSSISPKGQGAGAAGPGKLQPGVQETAAEVPNGGVKKDEEGAAASSSSVALAGNQLHQPQARLRRLSGAAQTADKYLTIVVHSAAWSVAGGLVASLLALTASLLTVF